MNTQRTCSFLILSLCILLANATDLSAQDTSKETSSEQPVDFTTDDQYPLDWEAEQYRWRSGVSWRHIDWSEDRSSWSRQQLHFGYNRPGGGYYNVQGRRYDRGSETERSIGVDAYPPLWGRAYANVTYHWSPDPETIPRNDVAATIYQPISKRWKIFPGYRKASFPSEDVDIYSFGADHYIGNWFLRSRLQYSREEDAGFSLDLNARYYFNRDHRLELGTSFGEETTGYFQDETAENRDTEIYRVQYQNYLTKNLGFDVEFRYRDMDGLPTARIGIIGLNYRFGSFDPSEVR